MRRVLETLKWEEAEWKQQADLRPDTRYDLAEGIHTLSIKQASIKNVLGSHFKKLWKSPLEEEVAGPEESTQPPRDGNNNDDDEEPGSDKDEDNGGLSCAPPIPAGFHFIPLQ